MLPNPATLAFVNTTLTDVPFLKLVNGVYEDTGAKGTVTILKNPDP